MHGIAGGKLKSIDTSRIDMIFLLLSLQSLCVCWPRWWWMWRRWNINYKIEYNIMQESNLQFYVPNHLYYQF